MEPAASALPLTYAGVSDYLCKALSQRVGNSMDDRPVMTLESTTGAVTSLQFSADGGKLIASIQGETALRMWRLDRLRERLRDLNLDW